MISENTLSLETGIYGGSISVLKNGVELAGWIGEASQTQSNKFLEAINLTIRNSGLNLFEIKKIVVSNGPGSYTGLRIGHSIAKGLKMACGASIEGVSAMEALLKSARPITITALPFGKNEVCFAKTEGNLSSENRFGSEFLEYENLTRFANYLKTLPPSKLLLPYKLHLKLLGYKDYPAENLEIVFCNENLARIIAMASRSSDINKNAGIFYLRSINK